MKHISIFLFLLVFNVAFSQVATLVGKITDQDNEPIFGANVIYRNDITLGAITDENGNYLLEVPAGKAIIVFRYSGMTTDTVKIELIEGTVRTLNFQLFPIQTKLEGIEIKVGKFDRPIEEQTVSIEIIKPELIENKNTRSIETALDQTPGLNILDGEPQIRGGSGFTFGVGSKVAIIVDDMPMLSGDAGRPEWSFIPVENIHQIEVIKGASSVLSGSSALSGAIHIRTAYPKAQPLTKVNLYSGFYSKPQNPTAQWWNDAPLIMGINALHTQQIKQWDVVLGANFNYDHGFIGPPIQDSLVEVLSPDTLSRFTNKQMQSKRARVNFNIRHRNQKIRGLNYGINGNFMTSESPMILAWLNDTSGIYQGYPGATFLQNQFIFNIDPFVNLYTSTGGKHHLRTRMLHADNKMSANQNTNTTTYYADYLFQKTIKELKNIDFIGGITYKFSDSYSNMYVGSGSENNQLLNVSAYSQIEKRVKNTLNLSIGGRLEHYSLNDSIKDLKPIFRAGASLKIYQETYLRASYGQGYRYPTITERFIKMGIGNFGVFPNNNLQPETSWNSEIGIKQGIKIFGIYGYLDIAGFWQEYNNTIEYLFGFWGTDPTAPINQQFGFRFLNTGKSRVLGLDISFAGKAELGKKANITYLIGYNYILPQSLNPNYVYYEDSSIFYQSYSFNNTSLDSSNRILKYRFLHNVKADIETNILDKFHIGMSAKYFSKIKNMDKVISGFEDLTHQLNFMQNIRYMDYFQANQKGIWIFDARIAYSLNDKHKLALIGTNILNKTYSLRPLKIETLRTIMLQYTFKLDKN